MRSDQETHARRFERLSRMHDYDVDRHEPDPRGWTVVNRDGRAVGEVKDLIVDTERMTAPYLYVELDGRMFDLHDADRYLLVPVERAHASGKRVVIDDLTPSWVRELCTARDVHQREFWDRWWHRGERAHDVAGTRLTRRVTPEELERAIDEVGPGETVRIPVVNEEIVVERRPIQAESRPLVAPRADVER